MDTDRDYEAEGADAALADHSDIPPEDVSEAGPDAEALWISGYEKMREEMEGA